MDQNDTGYITDAMTDKVRKGLGCVDIDIDIDLLGFTMNCS